ncbi:6-bladed beta-propeller [Cyclobacterium marinum]|uniref:6-bladed beta-propeller protein n=1 Tax=Cyclobacterium marinum (strain ATCC 25205 / DSM 745 / LMG 13164 / NCIMB 1802) TaxID=880070 RepID=G0IX43_CYCMS|nr:6-bladed beta-propeller [Cyclobacterium marinum]AEL25591.1 hypothetical protein Cycma_1839 [Cyclobacterium marinum DSM 745]MBR9776927.1 6-bladed beta-propeller [Cytophagales bacterium]|tara:strand:+ start:9132 stop:10268 length:1137 start_codon:yes stop_codon:yes gene_type:complete
MNKPKPILLSIELLLIFSMVACTNPETDEKIVNISIAPDDYPTLSYQDFTVEEMIRLETTEENLMGMDLRVKFSENLMAVMDENKANKLHLFDRRGSYLNAIAEVGEGPGTIRSLRDFEFGKTEEVLVLSPIEDKAKIFKFSKDGNFSEAFELAYSADSFIRLEGGGFLFQGGYNLPFVTHRVVRTDAEGKIQHRYLENDYENVMLPMMERNFFPSDKGVFMLEIFNPNIYLHKADSLTKVLHADFGTYDLPANFWDVDLMDSFGEMNENGFATFKGVFQQENLMVIDIVVQKGRSMSKHILFKRDKDIYKLKADRDDDMVFFYPIGINKKEQVLFLTYRSILEKHAHEFPETFSTDGLPKKGLDYPVILHVRLNEQL